MCSLIFILFRVTIGWSFSVPCLRLLSMPLLMPVLCLSGTLLSLTVDPKSWKRPVLPVSHATKLTCITANVLTMQETKSMPSASERGCNTSWRRAALQLEFALPRASIVGLHKTRSKNASARKSDTFFMVASAATKAGTDGCELWAATSLKPSSSSVRPIISKPSSLVVTLRLPFAQITVMVAHAPVEQQPRNVRENWWNECLESLMTDRVDFSALLS